VNGLLVDFFSPEEICDRIQEALEHPEKMATIRAKARETILERYDLSLLLPQHLQWIQQQEEHNDRLVSPWEGTKLEPVAIYKNGSNGKHEESENSVKILPKILKVHNQTVTTQEIIPLLNRYQLLPRLEQEILIDQAIASYNCTSEEKTKCYQEFCEQNQLSSEAERQAWLQQQQMSEAEFLDLATRKLRIEKFKKATWASKLEPYFRQLKPKLDRVIYSLIRVADGGVAQELYFRLLEGEQPFSELAKQYSQGGEAETGGLMGPVAMSTPHPKLSRILAISQPGQILPPINVGDWWVIVRLEKFIPAQLDESMRQRLLNELFSTWLKEQLQQQASQQQPVEIEV
jgi:parvulin-like peptidyl-prolyl isomerase